jgi:hypothetical protein
MEFVKSTVFQKTSYDIDFVSSVAFCARMMFIENCCKMVVVNCLIRISCALLIVKLKE